LHLKEAFGRRSVGDIRRRSRRSGTPRCDGQRCRISGFTTSVLVAAGEGAILAGQAEPHRECSMAVSGDSVAW
jgi:hypothetical protein